MHCEHEFETSRAEDELGVELTVLTCRLCGHLWLPDFGDPPPLVPLLL